MSIRRRRGLLIFTAIVWAVAAVYYEEAFDGETQSEMLIRSAATVIGLVLAVTLVVAWLLNPVLTTARVWLAIGAHQECDCRHGHERPPLRSVVQPLKPTVVPIRSMTSTDN